MKRTLGATLSHDEKKDEAITLFVLVSRMRSLVDDNLVVGLLLFKARIRTSLVG